MFNQGGVLKYIKQGETSAVTIGGTSGGIPNPIDADLIPTINNDGTPKRNIGAEGGKLWSNIWADFLNAKSFGAEFEGRFGIQETNPNVRNVAYPGENGTGENSDIFVLNKNGVLTARHRKKNSSGQWIADFEDFSLEATGGGGGGSSTNIPWGAVPQDLLPDNHADHDLGSNRRRWNTLHVNAIFLNGARLTAAGTTPPDPGNGGSGPDPVTGQVRIPFSGVMTFRTVTTSRLASLFGDQPGAIGCAIQSAQTGATASASHFRVWVRLSKYWLGLWPSAVVDRGQSDLVAHSGTQSASYLEYRGQVLPVNEAVAGIADPTRRFLIHEDASDEDDGSFVIVLRLNNANTLRRFRFSITRDEVKTTTTRTTQPRTGTFATLLVPPITSITHSSLNSAFGTGNGSIGIARTSIGTYFLYVKIGGWWCQFTMTT